MSKRLLTVSLAIAVASALIFIPLTAGGQEGRSEGAAPGAATPAEDSGSTVDGTVGADGWDGDGPAPRDFVIADDLIVDGSACIGFDCVNGESFGFDTIRLKENNIRIKAQDTSTSASFPTQDWQITFNDTSNGGANKFSIDAISPASSTPFTIEAGAPSNSLYVDDGGRIGNNTSTPVVDLHLVNGNTPTVRLEQNASSGFTPQTWDLAGNEANFFVRDATNGSTLPLRIRPGAPSNMIDVFSNRIELATKAVVLNDTAPDNSLVLATTGNVGIGNNTPGEELHIKGITGSPAFRLEGTGASWDTRVFAGAGNTYEILHIGDATPTLQLATSGIVTLQQLATAPGGPNGSLYVDTDSGGTLCFRSDGAWEPVAGGGACS